MAGRSRAPGWYLYDLTGGQIAEDAPRIADIIRSTVETPRRLAMEPATLRELRLKVEKHIKNTYLKQVQAPLGAKPVLKCWMELS